MLYMFDKSEDNLYIEERMRMLKLDKLYNKHLYINIAMIHKLNNMYNLSK